MRIKKLMDLCLMLSFTVISFGVVQAQKGEGKVTRPPEGQMEATMRSDDGIIVDVKTQMTPPNKTVGGYSSIYTSDENSGNRFYRILTDVKNKIHIGYDLVVEPLPEKGKYSVSIKPLSKEPKEFYRFMNASKYMPNYEGFTLQNLPEYQSGIILSEGDTMTLDILENPQTKSKISDVIVVTNANREAGKYVSDGKPSKDFTIKDVEIGMKGIDIYIDGKKYRSAGGGMSGAVIWVYFPGKGRFIMTPFEQPGYDFQKIGVIDNKQIVFNYDGSDYKFVSKDFVLGFGGKWNLWVMFDPNYKPDLKLNTEDPNLLVYGAVDGVKYLFEE